MNTKLFTAIGIAAIVVVGSLVLLIPHVVQTAQAKTGNCHSSTGSEGCAGGGGGSGGTETSSTGASVTAGGGGGEGGATRVCAGNPHELLQPCHVFRP
jgi:hypothetical protein